MTYGVEIPDTSKAIEFELKWVRVGAMVLNATFNNISVISWRSALLEEDGDVTKMEAKHFY